MTRNMWGGRALTAAAVVLAMFGLAGASLAQQEQQHKPHQKPHTEMKPEHKATIVSVAKENKDLSTFVKLVEAADLTRTLELKGPYTVFAPTNAAFDKLGKEELDNLLKPENKTKLQNILKHHVVLGDLTSAQLEKSHYVKCMLGQEMKIESKNGTVMFGTAKVTKADVKAPNGIIHLIDAVQMPEEIKPQP